MSYTRSQYVDWSLSYSSCIDRSTFLSLSLAFTALGLSAPLLFFLARLHAVRWSPPGSRIVSSQTNYIFCSDILFGGKRNGPFFCPLSSAFRPGPFTPTRPESVHGTPKRQCSFQFYSFLRSCANWIAFESNETK